MTDREEIQARLAEIQARAESATIGPWRVMDRPAELNGRPHVGVEAPHVERWNVVALTGHTGEHPMNVPDAEFIAHARDDVPFLLAEVARLRAQLDKPCGSCHPCQNYADETWRAAGRKPPHVYRWDETLATVTRLETELDKLSDPNDLAARLAAADLAWSAEHGDPTSEPRYIKHLATVACRLAGEGR